jgi:hypothetical protein
MCGMLPDFRNILYCLSGALVCLFEKTPKIFVPAISHLPDPFENIVETLIEAIGIDSPQI